jgi:hypothetical protein
MRSSAAESCGPTSLRNSMKVDEGHDIGAISAARVIGFAAVDVRQGGQEARHSQEGFAAHGSGSCLPSG